MNRIMKLSSAVAMGAFLCASPALAQDPTPQQRPNRQVENQRDNARRAGNLDEKTMGASVRVSQLIGMNIYDPRGESLGEIEDIVLDTNTGKVRYAAVTYGGFLGLGDKLFAVPFEAFKVRVNPEDRDETMMVLNITQQQLEGAQGFDQDHWPNFADRKFTDELDRRYKINRDRDSGNLENAGDSVDR